LGSPFRASCQRCANIIKNEDSVNWFDQVFGHPENAHRYPPNSIRLLLYVKRHKASSPTFLRVPDMSQEAIWFHRPPLLELWSAGNYNLDRALGLCIQLHYTLLIRKYWTLDAYVMVLRLHK